MYLFISVKEKYFFGYLWISFFSENIWRWLRFNDYIYYNMLKRNLEGKSCFGL